MNPNVNMAAMNPMGGPVGGAPMPMMNNGAMNPQAAAAAAAAAAASRQQQANGDQRSVLNTYIYEYFIRMGMFDCARSLLASNQQVNVKDGGKRRRDENGNVINGIGDDPMDTDSKDDIDSKLPDNLPLPNLPMPASDTSFLYEWFCVFWDIYDAQRAKSGNSTINQYVAHTQQQSRLKQNQQQELLRQMRPDMAQQQFQMMRNMQQNGGMPMNMKQGNLARAAMANNQNNPQMMHQQVKQNMMQRDPSGMADGRERPSSPASGENAPSPKRQRLDGAPFNPNQPGAMMPNGRPGQGMPGQQMPGGPNAAAAQQMLTANGINPNSLHPQQLQNFVNAPPAAQQKSIATYSQNLQQHHGTQLGGKQMPNAGPQGQGSPMMPGPDGQALNAYYNPGEMGGPGGIRPGPGGPQTAGGSNHALQDYQMQLMLLEQQNKKRLMMARQEQDTIGSGPREGGPAGPPGPNGPFPDGSPQAMRTGASPNPAEQMKRGTPQMNNSNLPSPVPDGAQSRDSPNNAVNFMHGQIDPSMAPHFFKGMEGNIGGPQPINGMRPPSSHPNQPFNAQMTAQMMAQRQQQMQSQGQPGNPQQWQQGPNGQGQMMSQQMQQQSPQIQGTPQQRSMPPPSAPAAAAAANNRTTASPQQAAAQPPTPSQTNKAAPKKKETKAAKEKRAANKKNNNNNNNANNANNNANNNTAGATPSNDNNDQQDTPAPATPINSTNATNFNKNGQAGGANGQATTGPAAAGAAVATSAPPAAPVGDPNQGMANMDNFGGMEFGSMDLANPLQTTDVLNDFDFDSFLHDNDGDNQPFDFNNAFSMEGNEIGAE